MHYKPNHLLSFFKSPTPLPVSEQLFGELCTLPLHPGLSCDEVRTVCRALKQALA